MRYTVHELRFRKTDQGERAFARCIFGPASLEACVEVAAECDDRNQACYVWPFREAPHEGNLSEENAPLLPLGDGADVGAGFPGPNVERYGGDAG